MKCLLTLIFCFIFSTSHAEMVWQPVMSGIASATIENVISYRIDPHQYQFRLAFASPTAFVRDLAQQSAALIAINGGYFGRNFKPLGLRLSQFQVLNHKRLVSWWGVFYLDKNTPKIVANRNYRYNKNINFAIQAGPRLLVKGKPTALKAGSADRSAICIDRQQNVILAVTNNHMLTLTEWAGALSHIGCVDALNLDGGTSSQLYTALPDYNHVVNNYKPVTDAIIVLKNHEKH